MEERASGVSVIRRPIEPLGMRCRWLQLQPAGLLEQHEWLVGKMTSEPESLTRAR